MILVEFVHRQSHDNLFIASFKTLHATPYYPYILYVAKTMKRLIEKENVIKESRLQCDLSQCIFASSFHVF